MKGIDIRRGATRQGLEPVSTVAPPALPSRPQVIRPSIEVNIWGRRVRLRGLRRPPTGIWAWLAILGPGFISGTAGNDAGAIATYSQVGAQFGYELLWVVLPTTVSLAVVQEMSGRLGAATGQGLLDLVRLRFGIVWAVLAVLVVLLANTGVAVAQFAAIGAAAELFGISRYLAVPVTAALITYLTILGTYNLVEKIFLAMTLVFLAYPVAAMLAHPNWGEVARGMFIPTVHADPEYITILVGLLGATLTPYQQLFQQSSVVEKGIARRHYAPERLDTYVGSIFASLMFAFIVIATGATLHVAGQYHIDTAADAARALQPVAGNAAAALFSIGLIGASMMAGAVVPIATAYSVTEAFGLPKGVSRNFRQAPVFFGLFMAMIVVAGGVALIPNVPVIRLIVWTQVLNGILLPIFLLFILLIANDTHLVGELRNSRLNNILGWATFGMVIIAVGMLLGSELLGLLGINVFSGTH